MILRDIMSVSRVISNKIPDTPRETIVTHSPPEADEDGGYDEAHDAAASDDQHQCFISGLSNVILVHNVLRQFPSDLRFHLLLHSGFRQNRNVQWCLLRALVRGTLGSRVSEQGHLRILTEEYLTLTDLIIAM